MEMNKTTNTSINKTIDKEGLKKYLEKIKLTSTYLGDDDLESLLNDSSLTDTEDESDMSDITTDTTPVLRSKRRPKQIIEENDEFRDFRTNIELLREENLKKDAMIEKMRKEHLLSTTELEERVKQLSHEKQLIEMKAAADLRNAEQKFKLLQDKAQLELSNIKARQQEIEARNPILKERLAETKAELKDLTISEARYVELKAIPEDQYSLKELVLVKVFEMTKLNKTTQEQLRKEIDTLTQKLRITQEELEKKNKTLEVVVRSSEEKERNLTREVSLLEAKVSKLDSALTEKMLEVDNMTAKSQNFDQVRARLEKAEREYGIASKDLTLKSAQMEQALQEREDATKRLIELQQITEILKMDKIYLAKEAENAKSRLSSLEDKVERQKKKLRETKKVKEELFQQVLKAREEQKMNYEQKLQTEIERLRTQTNADLEKIREGAKEVHERELRSIKDSQAASMLELEKVRIKYAETKQAYNDLFQEHRSSQLTLENKITELQNQIKLKAFEMERLGITYEDTLTNLKQSNVQIEQLRKKLEVVTTEYYTLQSEREKRVAELETLLAEKSEKLETYEALEKDLDMALISAGQELVNDTRDNYTTLLASMGTTVPAASKRRIKQTLQLSKKLMEVQKLNGELQRELEEEKAKVLQLSEEIHNCNDLISKTQQPYNFLIESIREKDKNTENQLFIIAELEKELKRVKLEKEDLERQIEDMQQQSVKLETLKQAAEKLQAKLFERKQNESINMAAPGEESQIHDEVPMSRFEEDQQNGITIGPGPLWFQKLNQSKIKQKRT